MVLAQAGSAFANFAPLFPSRSAGPFLQFKWLLKRYSLVAISQTLSVKFRQQQQQRQQQKFILMLDRSFVNMTNWNSALTTKTSVYV